MPAARSTTPTEDPASNPTGAGVKKPRPRPRPQNGIKSNKARNALRAMHAYIKEHRHKYPDHSYQELLKELGPQWKASREAAKNKA